MGTPRSLVCSICAQHLYEKISNKKQNKITKYKITHVGKNIKWPEQKQNRKLPKEAAVQWASIKPVTGIQRQHVMLMLILSFFLTLLVLLLVACPLFACQFLLSTYLNWALLRWQEMLEVHCKLQQNSEIVRQCNNAFFFYHRKLVSHIKGPRPIYT